MSWRIEPVNKNCIHERREFEGEHEVAISIYWRFGYIVVDEIPDLSNYNPDEGIELSSFEDWRFSDGSTELEIGADTPPDEIENIKKVFAEDGEDGLEMLGYQILDTNYRFLGKLKITDLTEVIEQIKVDIANMEDIGDLENALEKIDAESGIAKTDLYDKALRAGLQFVADVFNFLEYCELVSNTTRDSSLKFEALQQIRNSASGAHDLACAAKAAVEQLGDLSTACEIFDEGLNLAENKYDRIWLFEVALGCLNDADRAKNALSGFQEEEADSRDCREIAEAIAKHSKNKEWAANWYTKSLDLVADWEDQYRLIGSIGAYFKAPKLIKTAYERYSYLKSIGLGPKHAYRDYTDVDHLVLLGPQGIATSDGDGVHTTEECSLNEAWIWQAPHATTLTFLLPGEYSGPIELDTYRLSVIGLGNPEDIVISSDSENAILIESGDLYLNNITIVRKGSSG